MSDPRPNQRRSLIQLDVAPWLQQGRELSRPEDRAMTVHAIYGAILILTAIALYIYGRIELWWW